MKRDQIAQLLQHYMEGETTAEEEKWLRQYFSTGNYDAEFAAYAPLFETIHAEKTALEDEECDEILSLCTASHHSTRIVPKWWSYAAVWLLGIFLGGGGVWLAYGHSSIPDVAEAYEAASAPNVLAVADTVYHEHIVTRHDTIYIIKERTVACPQPATVAETHSAGGTGTRERKEETEQDLRPALPDVTWEETRNLASLVVR